MTENFYAPVDHQRFLGSTFVKRFEEVALQIGPHKWSRYQLANELGVGNYRAAALVTRALRKLKITKIEEVFAADPISLAGVHNLGETGMWVLLRALESKGYNTKQWYGEGREDLVTFRTLKMRRAKRERKRKGKRRS